MSFKFNSPIVYLSCMILFLIICSSCNNSELEYSIESKLNPFKISPLTALLEIKTEIPCRASIKVLGDSPIEQSFETYADNLSIPVVGLYPNFANKVVVTLNYEGGQIIDTIKIQTNNIPSKFPAIEINTLERNTMEPGMHGCDLHIANNGAFQSYPMIFDNQGKVRWYLDLSFNGKMVSIFQRLKDGTILMIARQVIYEFDMLGQLLKQTSINNNYGMHHDVVELPDGNLLICVGKRNAYIDVEGKSTLSDSDFVILYDRKNSKILKEWDLAKHLDVNRNVLNFFREGDWLHMNALEYDERDNSFIVSGRNQGLVKISWDDELKWILAPKNGWGKSGRNGKGFETASFLLTAVNSEGKPYDNTVQNGSLSDDNFDFSWSQHAPKLTPNGHLLVFDNGTYRNFDNVNIYSRAVEYSIDETNKTVTQVWQYGKERGFEIFSSIISDVDFLPTTDNILVTSGFIDPNGKHSAKIIEVDYKSGEEIFEATLNFKNLNGNRSGGWAQADILYRSERLKLKY